MQANAFPVKRVATIRIANFVVPSIEGNEPSDAAALIEYLWDIKADPARQAQAAVARTPNSK
jgi:hypothetical protein